MLSQTQCPRDIGQILAPEMAEAEVTGSPRDVPEGKWIPNGYPYLRFYGMFFDCNDVNFNTRLSFLKSYMIFKNSFIRE